MVTSTAPRLRWTVVPPPSAEAVDRLVAGLSIPRSLAALLVQRGHGTPEAARRFLRPQLAELGDPHALAGMGEAVDAIARAVREGRTILVHGDYDVDGQCATALLTRALRAAGARVTPFLPHRLRDGYDFGPAGLAAAREAGASLIVTCDCGITAVDAVRTARAAGIDVVVTDHHLPGPELPPAVAVVNPQRPDDRSDARFLCGTGVAFKLVQALVPVLGLPANLPYHFLDLVALATVADIVPLVGENRVLVRHGLRLLGESRWPGLRALARASGLAGKEIRAGQVGFILGPRLNAAGRLGDASDGLRLLLADRDDEADRLAARLETLNAQRQALDQRILDDAIRQVERQLDPDRHRGLVLAADDWHPGVVGIVASRVVERYGRPAVLIAFDGEIGKGSGRSVSRFDLHAALASCADLLERFGGHPMAAGVTIRRARLEEFRERFAAVARERLPLEALGPEQRVDLVLELDEVSEELERLCRHLEPCGMGNPAPVFGVRGTRLAAARRVGSGHLKGILETDRGRLEAIGFQWADRVPEALAAGAASREAPPRFDAAFRLECNEWQGQTTLQARLVALTPAALAGSSAPGERG
ncbi:MAG TPA: single-stranded-DNA-specific exonuclease RecJ [Gemmatimonadales bacterium]|nr:single-stranded-DNA-specific exonuclease RecJ [Gemmatimonadales bacterium]